MNDRRLLRMPVLVIAIAACLVTAPAAAAGPTIERIAFDEQYLDEEMSAECGVDVYTRERGQVITRTFDRQGTGPVSLLTINFERTYTSGDNTVRLRDVGGDLLRREPDGTLVVSLMGQVPLFFKGVIKIDAETGEVIQEPGNSLEGQLNEVCAALTA